MWMRLFVISAIASKKCRYHVHLDIRIRVMFLLTASMRLLNAVIIRYPHIR
jgi:hypothetical protein